MKKSIKIISYYYLCNNQFYFIPYNDIHLSIVKILNCGVLLIVWQLHRYENLRFSYLISS